MCSLPVYIPEALRNFRDACIIEEPHDSLVIITLATDSAFPFIKKRPIFRKMTRNFSQPPLGWFTIGFQLFYLIQCQSTDHHLSFQSPSSGRCFCKSHPFKPSHSRG